MSDRARLQAAASWRLVGLLFERPRRGWAEEITALAREVDDPDLKRAVDAALPATEGLYLALLGPGGPISPREVAHRTDRDPGAVVAEVRAFYEAFAYRPGAEDPVDHVAVEAGFAGYLGLKEAFALASDDRRAADLTVAARETFVAEHLSAFTGSFALALESSPAPYLAAAGRALVSLTSRKAPASRAG